MLLLALIVNLIACKTEVKKDLLTPIRYDYKNLKFTLNSSINDSISNGFWRWDYMTSNKGFPDYKGEDYFMNLSQPSFYYNGEETLPFLSIKVDGERIIEFSAIVIFQLTDRTPASISELLDNVTTFDLLKDEHIRQAIINKNTYKNTNADFEETLELQFSEENVSVYDSIKYTIKIN